MLLNWNLVNYCWDRRQKLVVMLFKLNLKWRWAETVWGGSNSVIMTKFNNFRVVQSSRILLSYCRYLPLMITNILEERISPGVKNEERDVPKILLLFSPSVGFPSMRENLEKIIICTYICIAQLYMYTCVHMYTFMIHTCMRLYVALHSHLSAFEAWEKIWAAEHCFSGK